MPADLRTLFGGATNDTNFQAIPGAEGRSLAMPGKGVSLKVLADQMDALRQVVEEGYSLAVATGLAGTAHGTAVPEEKAIQEMGVSEKEQYLAWKGGARLKDFLGLDSKASLEKWKGNPETLDKWVVGLRLMYNKPELVRENAVWWAVNASFLVPTITAHVKVAMAGKSMTDQFSALSAEEMAEYQTAKKILAEAAFRVQTIKKELNTLTQRIGRAEDVIITRVRHYQKRVSTKERKEAPENRNRKKRGLPTFDAPSDLSGMAGGSREARRRRTDAPRNLEQGRRDLSPAYTPQSPTGLFPPATDEDMGI